MKNNKFTAAYLRFHKQLTGLKEGKIKLVKKLGKEAEYELAAKDGLYQLPLGYIA